MVPIREVLLNADGNAAKESLCNKSPTLGLTSHGSCSSCNSHKLQHRVAMRNKTLRMDKTLLRILLEGSRIRDTLETNALTNFNTQLVKFYLCSAGEERNTYITCTTTPIPDMASLSTAFSMACEIVSKR